MAAKVLVACVGNIFLGDDAFGVEMARRLAEKSMPSGVSVVDFGIRGYDLAYALMNEWDLVILVDALPRGGQPGTLYTLEVEHSAPSSAHGSPGPDAHTMNPAAVLQLVTSMGGKCGRMLVVGCEPGTVEPSASGQFGLSEPVRAALDEAVAMVEKLVTGAQAATVA